MLSQALSSSMTPAVCSNQKKAEPAEQSSDFKYAEAASPLRGRLEKPSREGQRGSGWLAGWLENGVPRTSSHARKEKKRREKKRDKLRAKLRAAGQETRNARPHF